jgi:peptidoglycan/LPS O-acetylase OafA/YrhL
VKCLNSHIQDKRIPTREELKPLTDLRGIAVLAVFIYHVFVAYKIPLNPLTAIGWYGWAGVDLFFVLSGFLLYSKWQRGDYPSLRVYFAKRIGKIWPAFYVGITAYAIAGLLKAEIFTIPLYYIFISNYFPSTFTNLPFWTLYIEEAFYILLVFLGKIPKRYVPTLFLFSVTLSLWYSLSVPMTDYALKQLPRYLVDFTAGMLLTSIRIPSVMLLLFPLAIEVLNWQILNPFASVINALVFVAIIKVAAKHNLTSWPTYWLGKISYSFYIWHLLFITFFPPIFAFLLTVGVSALSYFVLEEWMRKKIITFLAGRKT